MPPYLRKYRKLISGCLRLGFWVALCLAGQDAASARLLLGWGFSGRVSRILGAILLVYVWGGLSGTTLPLNQHVSWLVLALMVSWATDDARFALDWRRRRPDQDAVNPEASPGS